MIVGPLLARFGKGYIPKPGGDKIGRRRFRTPTLKDLSILGQFRYNKEDHFYGVEAADGLTGADMLLDEASVTGTANIVMAAVLAKGKTTIYNAACEPYLQQLCKMMNAMGAKVSGIGCEPVDHRRGRKPWRLHTQNPARRDRNRELDWIGGNDPKRNHHQGRELGEFGIDTKRFQKTGNYFREREIDIYIPAHKDGYEVKTDIDGSILTIADAPWPGFTPDLLSIVLVVATQAKGVRSDLTKKCSKAVCFLWIN